MTKLFAVDSPESLREIAAFVKQGSVYNVATVWSATRRLQNDMCVWDGKILVSFYTSEKSRCAVVFRITASEEIDEFARLKYTPALAWCSQHLKEVEISPFGLGRA